MKEHTYLLTCAHTQHTSFCRCLSTGILFSSQQPLKNLPLTLGLPLPPVLSPNVDLFACLLVEKACNHGEYDRSFEMLRLYVSGVSRKVKCWVLMTGLLYVTKDDF